MEDLMIKIDNVKKQYRLGAIGGGTLQGDLQTWWAKVRGKEDPNSKIGAKVYKKNEKFMALDGVSLEVKKGERVGIIGHNGAGKSTLLKLLSRVTAPTEGQICLNGRVASMLEVGTGFHGELTGRENIYMNGAILGMTKAEIDAKIEDIIEFSECRQFIDTPVKRYSSGMYVKLAFSVAAHLDSEIMIMDEVLAVGDMSFQKKCLDKMSQVSESEGRTILYVSHNMNTIRQLCDRVVVLDHGKVVFDGDIEEGINVYLNNNKGESSNHLFFPLERHEVCKGIKVIDEIAINHNDNIFTIGEDLVFTLNIHRISQPSINTYLRVILRSQTGSIITMIPSMEPIDLNAEYNSICYHFKLDKLVPSRYSLSFVLYDIGEMGVSQHIDVLRDVYSFWVKPHREFNHGMKWFPEHWGYTYYGFLEKE